MGSINYTVVPTAQWNVIDIVYDEASNMHCGIAVYPDYVIWKPTENLTGVKFIDKYGNVFDTADYNIIWYQQFSVDLVAYRLALNLDVTNYRTCNQNDVTVRKMCERLGIQPSNYSPLYWVTDESKLPFKVPSDAELGKIDNLTDGSYPYTGFYPTGTLELPSRTPFGNFTTKRSSAVLTGTATDVSFPFSTGSTYKLPPLFSPIVGNSVDSYQWNVVCTYLGIEPKLNGG